MIHLSLISNNLGCKVKSLSVRVPIPLPLNIYKLLVVPEINNSSMVFLNSSYLYVPLLILLVLFLLNRKLSRYCQRKWLYFTQPEQLVVNYITTRSPTWIDLLFFYSLLYDKSLHFLLLQRNKCLGLYGTFLHTVQTHSFQFGFKWKKWS